MIKELLNVHLKAHTGLTALVGNNVFPMVGGVDQAMPAVTYNLRMDNEVDLAGDVVLERYQLQVYAVATHYSVANDVASEVKEALDILNASFGGGAVIQRCWFESDSEEFDDELGAYIITLNFTLVV